MCHLFETIRVENGVPVNLEYHQRRVDRSRKALFGETGRLELSRLLPAAPRGAGTFKWRIVYDRIVHGSTLEPYLPKQVKSLQMVRNDRAEYPFKYQDRAFIEEMLAQKGGCDDILVVRNGLITDASYANVVFLYGKSWVTPRNPLLPGTCRERLLETAVICEAEISENDLHLFKSASLINAMMEPGQVAIKMEDIIPVPSNR